MTGFESIMGCRCPYCQGAIFWTEVPADHVRHHQEYPHSDVILVPGIDGGGWRPTVELQIRGRAARVALDHLPSVSIYPMQCPGCKKVLVAHLGITNVADVEHYENMVRPYRPPKRDGDEVEPQWAMVGRRPAEFVAEVNGVRNPMVKGGLIRRLNSSRFRFEGLDVEGGQLQPPPRRNALPR